MRCILCTFVVGLASAWAQPVIPDTPAGRIFQDWFETFNSGDPALLRAHYQKHQPGQTAERDIQLRTMTGGFDLLAVEESQPHRLVFRGKERLRDTTVIGVIAIDEKEPTRVTRFLIRAIPPGSGTPDFKIDSGLRERVIDEAINKLNEHYVFPDIATKMAEDVRARQRRGRVRVRYRRRYVRHAAHRALPRSKSRQAPRRHVQPGPHAGTSSQPSPQPSSRRATP